MKILRWLFAIFLTGCTSLAFASEDKMSYWNTQRKGANFFNKRPTPDWFVAAKDAGIQFVRLAPDKWKSQKRDFLIGDADQYTEIPTEDFEKLKDILDQAHANEIKVIITLLSLPGSRWRQNNHNEDDLRIWQQNFYQSQAIRFWKDLASQLKNHPAVFGYNILNEPHPECLFGIYDYREIDFEQWYKTIQGSPSDLNLFYQKVVGAIREVDSDTPIVIDTGLFGTPWAINYLTPLQDTKILYSFHMYEPYALTTRKINKGRFEYPGIVPLLLKDVQKPDSEHALWNKEALKHFLRPISEWQIKHKIPSSQIVVGEFGCDRTIKGAAQYFSDLLEIFNFEGWHWAFYSFREDVWDSMDYELGTDQLSWKYWEAAERGVSLDPFRNDNPLFDVLKNQLR
jgi:endoglucanase